MTNGMGLMGFGMGFGTNGIWDSPIPFNMGGKYRHSYEKCLWNIMDLILVTMFLF
jgi:hypothetical protein